MGRHTETVSGMPKLAQNKGLVRERNEVVGCKLITVEARSGSMRIIITLSLLLLCQCELFRNKNLRFYKAMPKATVGCECIEKKKIIFRQGLSRSASAGILMWMMRSGICCLLV